MSEYCFSRTKPSPLAPSAGSWLPPVPGEESTTTAPHHHRNPTTNQPQDDRVPTALRAGPPEAQLTLTCPNTTRPAQPTRHHTRRGARVEDDRREDENSSARRRQGKPVRGPGAKRSAAPGNQEGQAHTAKRAPHHPPRSKPPLEPRVAVGRMAERASGAIPSSPANSATADEAVASGLVRGHIPCVSRSRSLGHSVNSVTRRSAPARPAPPAPAGAPGRGARLSRPGTRPRGARAGRTWLRCRRRA